MELRSTNASGGVAFTLYRMGDTTAFTLGSGQYITITDILLICSAEVAYAICGATDVIGRTVVRGTADENGGLAHRFETPYQLPKGITPRLFADAGKVDCTMTGYLQGS
jgi:hypothetical protein